MNRPDLKHALRLSKHRVKGGALFGLYLWGVASAGIAFADNGPTTPTGMGGLMPMPDLAGGSTKSLFEATGGSFTAWQLDTALGRTDFLEKGMGYLVDMLWSAVLILARGAVGLSWWLFGASDTSDLTKPLSDMIGASSQAVLTTLMPTAIAVGVLTAFLKHKGGDLLDALAWVAASAIMGLSLALAPHGWVGGVDLARNIGAEIVSEYTSAGVSPSQDAPFKAHETDYGGNSGDRQAQQNTMMRRSGDAVWRGLVATPWCIAEFGSLNACQRYAPTLIDKTGDDRTNYIKNTITASEGGKDAPTVKWTKGFNPGNRLAVVLITLVMVLTFGALTIGLGFGALAAIASAVLHLLVGGFFVSLWCIEGTPRSVGLRWLSSLATAVFSGILSLLLFGASLTFITLCFALLQVWGWLPIILMVIATLVVAIKLRSSLATFFIGAGAGLTASARRGIHAVTSRRPRPSSRRSNSQGGGATSTRRRSAPTQGAQAPRSAHRSADTGGTRVFSPAPRRGGSTGSTGPRPGRPNTSSPTTTRRPGRDTTRNTGPGHRTTTETHGGSQTTERRQSVGATAPDRRGASASRPTGAQPSRRRQTTRQDRPQGTQQGAQHPGRRQTRRPDGQQPGRTTGSPARTGRASQTPTGTGPSRSTTTRAAAPSRSRQAPAPKPSSSGRTQAPAPKPSSSGRTQAPAPKPSSSSRPKPSAPKPNPTQQTPQPGRDSAPSRRPRRD